MLPSLAVSNGITTFGRLFLLLLLLPSVQLSPPLLLPLDFLSRLAWVQMLIYLEDSIPVLQSTGSTHLIA
jgi:hypothetical protein